MNLESRKLEHLLDVLPENRPIYKDSGLWHIMEDDMSSTYITQMVNEPLKDFVIRYLRLIKSENKGLFIDICIDLVSLSNGL